MARRTARRKTAHPMGVFNNETLFKKFFVATDWADTAGSVLAALAGFVFALATLLFCSLVLFDFGFRKTTADNLAVQQTYLLLLWALFVSKLLGKEYEVDLSCDPHRPLGAKDRLIVIGRLDGIKRFVD